MMMETYALIKLFVILCICHPIWSLVAKPMDPYKTYEFTQTTNGTLNHFTVSDNGSIYLGGVDVLYRLSADLGLIRNNTNETLGIIKVLEIATDPVPRLITCGSGLERSCQLRDLTTMDKVDVINSVTVAPGNDTTVGLVSPGGELYVAQTVSFSMRSPPISIKCLPGNRDESCKDRSTTLLATSGPRMNFIIHYTSVFAHDGFTYFLASQMEDAKNPSDIVPKLSRVCHDDSTEKLNGFTEVVLDCKGVNRTYAITRSARVYNNKLYAVFVGNVPIDNNLNNFNPGNQSALCVYDMSNVISAFQTAVRNCSCETEDHLRGINSYLNGRTCLDGFFNCTKSFHEGLFCEPNIRYPASNMLKGGLPGELLFEQDGESFSSILVTRVNHSDGPLIGIIGTSEGNIFKVRINRGSGVLYERLNLPHPVLSDIDISDDTETITVLTERQLLKLSVANCSQYQTCDECVKPGTGEGDPYCGWCTLEKKCTRYRDCIDSNATNRWLTFTEESCVKILSPEPASLPADTEQTMVTLEVTHLPEDLNYTCHFGDFESPAEQNNASFISCFSPNRSSIPPIPNTEDAINVTLSVSSSAFSGIKFVETTFSFFNCSRIYSCVTCVTKWPCDWCLDDLVCAHGGRGQSHSNISHASSEAGGACPQLLPDQTTIDVPADVTRTIQVNATHLNKTSHQEYECVLTVGSEDINSSATYVHLEPDSGEVNVTCSARDYSYEEWAKEKGAILRLRWRGTNVFVDGLVEVTLYKCGVERPDCSRCLSPITMRPELECRWCLSSKPTCVHESNCIPTNEASNCTAGPVVEWVFPRNGSVDGGTLVQINGTDLGLEFRNIDKITLAGIECDHREEEKYYRTGASVTCRSGESNNTGGGLVLVTVRNQTSTQSVQFSYKNASIDSFSPKCGPMSGGTVINITGSDLNIGKDITVELGNKTCDITYLSAKKISCVTEASDNQSSSLVIQYDGEPRESTDNFIYYPNPNVTDIQPRESIKSGGNNLTVSGTGFHLIRRPQIVFTSSGGIRSIEECQKSSSTEMFCPSPRYLGTERRRRAEEEGIVDRVAVGFIMDGVKDLLTWSNNDPKRIFEVKRDPMYERFPGEDSTKYYSDSESFKTFVLKGTDLDVGSEEWDVEVYIGNTSCSAVQLGPTKLTCTPESLSIPSVFLIFGRSGGGLPLVTVHHANLVFEIGYVAFTNYVLVILSSAGLVIGLLLLIILCALCYVGRVRSQKAAKIHDLELQVLEIQDSISGNLKSLFATLQTTADNFDATLSQMKTIPLLNKRQYLLNMLFLGLNTEPPTEPSGDVLNNPNIKVAMDRFSVNLLSKKDFLEVLIRALDQNTNIGSMEKVNIASLLSICLLHGGKQELLTTVMISLMREQIQDCDPKAAKYRILFSRSETVLEKLLSNWITVFQYQYLKNHAAKPLHHLFHAIKYVCEMGPIDAVTGKSQFSINDQQMLEKQIAFNELSLSVIVNSVTGEKEEITVLDVNTVTQVKQRIISHLYKDVPFSKQPDPYMYDLMWRTGRGGQLILRDDDDLSGNTENDWKKINTMVDFSVTSGVACFELVEKQANPNTTLDVASSPCGKKTGAEGAAASKCKNQKYQATVFRHSSFRGGSLPAGMKPWHLVKEEELEDEDDDESKIKPKEIKEVVLPFLPATRNYIKKYVDSFINVALTNESDAISPSIRYLFQFFDREADKLEKPEYAKAWKDNAFALRFWATILANPQYTLDLGIHSYTTACLRILVQVLKDTCAGRSKPIKTDYSPSRLLFSNLMPGYISKLAGFYDHARGTRKVSAADMAQECTQVELDFERSFDLVSTQYELYRILESHKDMLMAALDDDDVCNEADMAGELQAITQEIAGH